MAVAQTAIGTALRSLGPHIVLTALPLNIVEGLAGVRGSDGKVRARYMRSLIPCTHKHTHMHTHMYVHTCTREHIHTRTHTHTHMHSHKYPHTHTYKHKHTQTHTASRASYVATALDA